MANNYGIQLTNMNGDFMLEEGVSSAVVLESRTVNRWFFDPAAGTYSSSFLLNQGAGYLQPPIIAQRSNTAGFAIRESMTSRVINGVRRYTGVTLFATSTLESVTVAVLASAADGVRGIPVESGETYGMQMLDAAGNITFDSRWSNLVTMSNPILFPNISTSGSTGTTPTATPMTISLSNFDNPGLFFILGTVSGLKTYQSGDVIDDEGIGFGALGGGRMAPAVRQTGNTTASVTAAVIALGPRTGARQPAYQGCMFAVRIRGL